MLSRMSSNARWASPFSGWDWYTRGYHRLASSLIEDTSIIR